MKKLFSVVLIGASAISSTAYAQDEYTTGLYVHLRAGLAAPNNPSVHYAEDIKRKENTFEVEANLKRSATYSGEIGYKFGNLRLGAELSHHRNKAEAITFKSLAGATPTAADMAQVKEAFDLTPAEFGDLKINGKRIEGPIGKLSSLSLMANATYDIPLDSPIQPYVGAGIGGLSSQLHEGDDDFRFAWQVRAGAAFKLSRKFALTADYTYRQSNETAFRNGNEELRFGRNKASLFQVGLRADF